MEEPTPDAHRDPPAQPPVGASPPPSATVGPSPAPGTGSPATRTRLGRLGVILIVVIGILYFAGWIAWAIFGPDLEVKVRTHRDHRRERSEPQGPGRLTLTAPDGRTARISAESS